MPEKFVVWVYIAVSLARIHCALYKITDPMLTIIYANVPAIVTRNILDNRNITRMRLIVDQAEACVN
ncbi:hypothetical protein [Enterobacter soli]|uniref:hypothetical protein n=1 Tax=Enterobacter soli TaxID=885040 RepID=UPI00059B190E